MVTRSDISTEGNERRHLQFIFKSEILKQYLEMGHICSHMNSSL